ncbi:hypothetical protein SAICODRAFT_141510 [Saitoella complicata NRRL Y-17804]|uniref:uncharacterized protein n=1 Tax=Saitoella complicata (strain BCRC 22490 / CBS 7301 / JCM 7358 / NBRC 10748 / NRRL Y-17804) TaxID=698492 RepID=UPI000867D5F5|nr:uncharacterized protein SAICODRAFT_141510 [Saitoella complicata NRRL Y-17804]ODQ52018.1 hypothetical protein SAICODRAFT_141510 [Saitoella complicata NRRL Y-17804]
MHGTSAVHFRLSAASSQRSDPSCSPRCSTNPWSQNDGPDARKVNSTGTRLRSGRPRRQMRSVKFNETFMTRHSPSKRVELQDRRVLKIATAKQRRAYMSAAFTEAALSKKRGMEEAKYAVKGARRARLRAFAIAQVNHRELKGTPAITDLPSPRAKYPNTHLPSSSAG